MKASEDGEAGVLEIEILTAGRLMRGRRPEEFIYSQFLESESVKPRCLQALMCLSTPNQDNWSLGSGQGLATCSCPGRAGVGAGCKQLVLTREAAHVILEQPPAWA